MIKSIGLISWILLFTPSLIAQTNFGLSSPVISDPTANQLNDSSIKLSKRGKKGKFYIYWGYNGSAFTKSDIHFSGPDYDFTVFDVKAHDRPSRFSPGLYLNPTTISIPQYNYRAGYYLTDRWSISFGEDHMKYVMDENQTVKMSGVIDESVSSDYDGVYLNDSIVLTEEFLKFEHTDGLNLLSLDVEYTLPITSFVKGKINIALASGMGGVWVIPRTDVKVFGEGINNKFHLAGYCFSAKTGPRMEFFDNFFLLAQARAGYVTLPDILLNDNVPQRANQNFSFIEYYAAAGITFPFHKKQAAIKQ